MITTSTTASVHHPVEGEVRQPHACLDAASPSEALAAETIVAAADLDTAQAIHRRRALHDGIENAVALGDALGIPPVSLAVVLGQGHGPNPDADLLALGREWQASADRCDALRIALDAACQECADIPIPEALFLRVGDCPLLYRLASASFRSTARRWFHPAAVRTLRDMPDPHRRIERREPAPWGGNDVVIRVERQRDEPAFTRKAEILAAHDAWTAATKAEEDRTGCTALEIEDEAANAVNRDLRQRIMVMQAHTFAGVLVKARVAGWCMGSSAEIRELVDQSAAQGDLTGEQVALGAVADLVAMLERGAA